MPKRAKSNNETRAKRGERNETIDPSVAESGASVARAAVLRGSGGARGVRGGVAGGSRQKAEGSKPKAANAQAETEALMKLMLKDLCSISQAAEILGVDSSQAYRLVASKRIVAVQLDGWFWVVYKPSLETYLTTKSKRGRPASGSKNRTKFLRKLVPEST